MTREQLDAIRARVDAATPGPWYADSCLDVYTEQVREIDPDIGIELYKTVYSHHTAGPEGTQPWHDTHFMAHAREDVPALLAEVERLTAERDALIRWRDGWLAADEAYENIRTADAFQRGVAAMREAAVAELLDKAHYLSDDWADDLRALPDPEDKS